MIGHLVCDCGVPATITIEEDGYTASDISVCPFCSSPDVEVEEESID